MINKDNTLRIPEKIQLYVKELRKRATRAEITIRRILEVICEREGIPLAFQHPIELDAFKWAIVDFLIDEKLVIELDGKHHYENGILRRCDRERDRRLTQIGIKVIRVTNEEAMTDPIHFCLEVADDILRSKGKKRSITRAEIDEMVERKLLKDLGLPSPSTQEREERKAYSPTHKRSRTGAYAASELEVSYNKAIPHTEHFSKRGR